MCEEIAKSLHKVEMQGEHHDFLPYLKTVTSERLIALVPHDHQMVGVGDASGHDCMETRQDRSNGMSKWKAWILKEVRTPMRQLP